MGARALAALVGLPLGDEVLDLHRASLARRSGRRSGGNGRPGIVGRGGADTAPDAAGGVQHQALRRVRPRACCNEGSASITQPAGADAKRFEGRPA